MLSHPTGGSRTRAITLLVLSFIILASILFYVVLNGSSLALDGFYGFGNANNADLPNTYTIDVQFSEHEEYKELGPEYDHLWDELLTENGGFLIQEDPKERQVRKYGIGMFHQLHCLQMIRGALAAATAPDEIHADGKHAAHGGSDPLDDHTLHCFDYLRQVSAFGTGGNMIFADINKVHSLHGRRYHRSPQGATGWAAHDRRSRHTSVSESGTFVQTF